MDTSGIERNIKVAVNMMKTMSNERRLMILCSIYNEEKNVSELEQIVGLSQSALSQHLARLRRDKMVETRRDAQAIYYSMSEGAPREVLRCLHNLYCANPSASSSRDAGS